MTRYFYKNIVFTLDFLWRACYNLTMKNVENQKKVFPLKLSKLIITLCFVCIALCLAGIGVTIFRIVRNGGIHGILDALKFPMLILVCLFCIALVVSILIRSQYTVDETNLTTAFGFIKSQYPIKDFTSMTVNSHTHKLTVYQGEEFFVLTVKEAWENDLVQAILQSKPDIEVSYVLTDNTPPKEEKKDE